MDGEGKKPDGRKNNGRKKGTTVNKIKGKIAPKKDNFGSALVKTNKYQSQTIEEFLKVRDGETFEQWSRRTESRRIHGISKNNNISIAKRGIVEIKPDKLKGMDRTLQLKVLNRFIERPYDYLENYAFILRWASVRYGISKDDIEIAFYFYNKGMFTDSEFNRVCLMLGTVRGVWARFIRNQYVVQSFIITKDDIVKEFEYYQFTNEFLRLLRAVYGALSKINKLTLTARTSSNYKRNVVSPELNEFLEQLNREIIEVDTNKLTPHFKQ